MAPECDRVYILGGTTKRWAEGLIASGAEMVPAKTPSSDAGSEQ